MKHELREKSAKLKQKIYAYKSALVAFSGGTDSTLLLKIVCDALGNDNVIAITTVSELLPASELAEAKSLAKSMGVLHLTVFTEELTNEFFINNSRERCYFCKHLRYIKLLEFAKKQGFDLVLDGTNADDDLDIRPGIRALEELGIKTPLRAVGLTKKEIRILAKELGLKNWQKPSSACLASRIPYGDVITKEKLLLIEEAEDFLKTLGFGQLRVRHYGTIAKIEVEPEEFSRVTETAKQIVAYFKSLGYTDATLDLQGFRSGSMNEK